ncbi:hypothetical protein [Variovorax sp. PAMC26660]|uniref:hypothetical protein n=1 Tax=Variovorax sp. PAMC26660 TaxID=2762322 RepID=UPI00164EA4C6|nr:hypothetical protein [Variovorax sp. PAMC26660]QNK66516.1 hypothetical protein H7F35_25485 [Variovorax sp. PAMC26660]
MKKLLVTLTVLLGAASAFAQSDNGVRVSTDPARAAAVESHAQQLQARPAEKPMAMHDHAPKMHKHQARHHHAKPHAKKS